MSGRPSDSNGRYTNQSVIEWDVPVRNYLQTMSLLQSKSEDFVNIFILPGAVLS